MIIKLDQHQIYFLWIWKLMKFWQGPDSYLYTKNQGYFDTFWSLKYLPTTRDTNNQLLSSTRSPHANIKRIKTTYLILNYIFLWEEQHPVNGQVALIQHVWVNRRVLSLGFKDHLARKIQMDSLLTTGTKVYINYRCDDNPPLARLVY